MKHPFSDRLLTAQKSLLKTHLGRSEENLLRLHLMRDLTFRLHTEQSRLLAVGKKNEALDLLEDEKNILSLDSNSKDPSVIQLPKEFLLAFSKGMDSTNENAQPEIWDRMDRHWEKRIASEALDINWAFWTLTLTIDIYELENFHKDFQTLLWPQGIILWAMNAESSEPEEESVGGNTPPDLGAKETPTWRGTWNVVLHSKVDPVKTMNSQLASLRGVSGFSNPVWDLKYSKNR